LYNQLLLFIGWYFLEPTNNYIGETLVLFSLLIFVIFQQLVL